MASACAGTAVYQSRYPSGSGVRQAAPGAVVRSKACARGQPRCGGSVPRMAALSLSPRLCHPSLAQLWESSLSEDPCCGSGWCWMPQVYVGCPSVWTRCEAPLISEPAYSLRRGAQHRGSSSATSTALPMLSPCQAPLPALSLPVSLRCKALRTKPTCVLSEMSLK